MSQYAVSLAIFTMVSWGVWTVLANEATRSIEPEVAMILSYGASVVVALTYVAVQNDPITVERTGVGLAVLAGVFSGIGAVAFYTGLSVGRAGIVTTVSALYFIVAALLGVVFLGESFTATDALGVGFAALAVVLISH